MPTVEGEDSAMMDCEYMVLWCLASNSMCTGSECELFGCLDELSLEELQEIEEAHNIELEKKETYEV